MRISTAVALGFTAGVLVMGWFVARQSPAELIEQQRQTILEQQRFICDQAAQARDTAEVVIHIYPEQADQARRLAAWCERQGWIRAQAPVPAAGE